MLDKNLEMWYNRKFRPRSPASGTQKIALKNKGNQFYSFTNTQ